MPDAAHHDSGKPPLALLPMAGLAEISKVLEFGAGKYDRHNWLNGMPWIKLANSILRHTFAWIWGETNDRESGLNHLAHAGCDVLFLLEYAARGLGTDDRWVAPARRPPVTGEPNDLCALPCAHPLQRHRSGGCRDCLCSGFKGPPPALGTGLCDCAHPISTHLVGGRCLAPTCPCDLFMVAQTPAEMPTIPELADKWLAERDDLCFCTHARVVHEAVGCRECICNEFEHMRRK